MPTFITSTSATEGDVNTVVNVNVLRSGGDEVNAQTYNIVLTQGTATAGSDYVQGPSTIAFAAGQTFGTFAVTIVGDNVFEPTETFDITLTPQGGGPSSATNFTITDNDPTPAISIASVSANEGNVGTTAFTFAVTLSNPSSQTVTVNYATANGTATVGSDYTATSGTVTFAPGVTSQNVTVQVIGDSTYEAGQTFNVTLSAPTNATIANGTGVGTILNDDAVPTLTVDSVVANEGVGNVFFTVSRSGDSELVTTFDYTTVPGTAVAGSDYTATSGSTSVAAGSTGTTQISVPIINDATFEQTEQFTLVISNPTNATLGTATGVATINDDDPASAGVLSISSVNVNEGDGTATLVVTRTGGTSAFAVNYATANGTALAVSDYTATTGTLNFAANQNSATVIVPIVNDTVVENSESFTVTLSNPTGAATLGTATGTVTIADNDPRSTGGTDTPSTPTTPGTPANTPTSTTVGASTFVSADYSQPADSTAAVVTTQNNSGTAPINLTGNAGTQTIIGNYGPNVINGGLAGSDTLIGLLGNDTYVVTNAQMVVIENGGEGIDTVQVVVTDTVASEKVDGINAPGVTYALQADASVEFLAIQNASSTTAVNLTGSTIAQTITGNAGANIINGFGGGDTMIGLGGNDQYLVRGAGDVVIEANGGGTDTVFTTVSYSLGVNEVEVLSTVTNSDTTAIDLIGNFATQTIVGNYGNNVLNGGSGGLDTLIGLRGNDIYAVGDSRTVIVEAAGEGSDTVVTAVDYTLAAGVSVEVLAAQDRAGTTSLALRGNEIAQTIVGNNGANVLDGGLGSDTLAGGGGADSFRFTTALGANNVDSIADFESGLDKIGLSSSVFGLSSVTATNFTVGAAATTADQRIVFNQATGQLFFDADGNGAGAAVLFAMLTPGTILTAASFEVVPGITIA